MENSYLNRAKALLRSGAGKGALVVLTLAAAVPATAGQIVLPTSNLNCIILDANNPAPGGFCSSGSAAVTQLGAGGLEFSPSGLSLAGSGSFTMSTAGAVSQAIPAGTTISYNYDFFLQETLSDPSWSLTLAIADEGATPGPGTLIGATSAITGSYDTTNREFSGSGTFTTNVATNANDILEVYFGLQVSGFTAGGNPFTFIQIPASGSIDFLPPTATPEPSSVGLVCAGLGWLGWKLRRRRAS